MVDRVGWQLGDKRGDPLYKRDPSDGTYVFDEDDQLIPDSDFEATLSRIRESDAAQFFPWLVRDLPQGESLAPGWTVSIDDVLKDEYLTLDPKRYTKKVSVLRAEIRSKPYFRLGDIVDFMPESTNSDGERTKVVPEKLYRYAEINDVGVGTYRWQNLHGWEVPARGKHHAEPGDIYIGGIWNCVTKWFLAPRDCEGLVVTNGFLRLRLKPGAENSLLDLITGLCSEAFATQMRSFARGSLGLAEIQAVDAADVILPFIQDPLIRSEMEPFIRQLQAGFTSIEAKVSALLRENRLPLPIPPARPHHTSIV